MSRGSKSNKSVRPSAPPPSPASRPPRAPQVYVRPSGGNSGIPWVLATVGLLFFVGAALATYFNSPKKGTDATAAAPADQAVTPADTSGFKLPEIVIAEEKSDAPIYDPSAIADDDFHFITEPEDVGEDPAPAAKSAEKPDAPEDVPGAIPRSVKRSFIENKTPNIAGVPEDRVVDILCLYTTQYKNRYGKGDSKKIVKRITDIVGDSNKLWQNQIGKQVAVRIVGVAETTYLDVYHATDLGRLNRNEMSTVAGTKAHTLRKTLGADMVALFGTKGGGGVSSGNPFFIVKRGSGIFTHECQHAFGWGHKEQLAPPKDGDDVSKLGKTAPGRSAWMPKKTPDGKIWFEYNNR